MCDYGDYYGPDNGHSGWVKCACGAGYMSGWGKDGSVSCGEPSCEVKVLVE